MPAIPVLILIAEVVGVEIIAAVGAEILAVVGAETATVAAYSATVGAAAVSGATTLINGGDAEDVLRSAITAGATSFVAGAVSNSLGTAADEAAASIQYGTEYGSQQTALLAASEAGTGSLVDIAGNAAANAAASAASGATKAAVNGGDILDAAITGLENSLSRSAVGAAVSTANDWVKELANGDSASSSGADNAVIDEDAQSLADNNDYSAEDLESLADNSNNTTYSGITEARNTDGWSVADVASSINPGKILGAVSKVASISDALDSIGNGGRRTITSRTTPTKIRKVTTTTNNVRDTSTDTDEDVSDTTTGGGTGVTTSTLPGGGPVTYGNSPTNFVDNYDASSLDSVSNLSNNLSQYLDGLGQGSSNGASAASKAKLRKAKATPVNPNAMNTLVGGAYSGNQAAGFDTFGTWAAGSGGQQAGQQTNGFYG